jgi:hypothetical protein
MWKSNAQCSINYLQSTSVNFFWRIGAGKSKNHSHYLKVLLASKQTRWNLCRMATKPNREWKNRFQNKISVPETETRKIKITQVIFLFFKKVKVFHSESRVPTYEVKRETCCLGVTHLPRSGEVSGACTACRLNSATVAAESGAGSVVGNLS